MRARIVIGLGEDSAGQLLDRTSHTLAALLGDRPVPFPGGHIAFVLDPPGFAPRLREVRICLDRSLKPRACSATAVRGACRAATLIVAPIR